MDKYSNQSNLFGQTLKVANNRFMSQVIPQAADFRNGLNSYVYGDFVYLLDDA